MVTAVLFISFIVLLLISVPIGIALGLASLATILLLDPISMETFSQSMVQGLNSFPLIAVPLFAFAGDIMGKGGRNTIRFFHLHLSQLPVQLGLLFRQVFAW